MNPKKNVLPIIVIAQFCCTTLWFASNGVIEGLAVSFSLNSSAIGHLTSAVQFGFISGTLIFAVLTVADRFSPSKVFFWSAVAGALFNLGALFEGNTMFSLILLRFFTGFFLAGIYPVGMKIASDYYNTGLGKSLGYLVGALVLGTAFPHFLSSFSAVIPWRTVFLITSLLALLGGLLMLYLVPNGPYRIKSQSIDFSVCYSVFKQPHFRSAAFGYFGHMWELYAFWAFLPVVLHFYNSIHSSAPLNVSLWSFIIIASGSISCIASGLLSQKYGAKKIAVASLLISGICCLISPLLFSINSTVLFLGFLLVWGMAVIADSPLFSTMVATNVDAKIKGTALTIVNCLGFAITILSIQLITFLHGFISPIYFFVFLAIGPAFGLYSVLKK